MILNAVSILFAYILWDIKVTLKNSDTKYIGYLTFWLYVMKFISILIILFVFQRIGWIK